MWSIDELRACGFKGFLKVSELRSPNCKSVPEKPGVYMVLRPAHMTEPRFQGIKEIKHKGRILNASIDILKKKWVKNTFVLYIGKAGEPSGWGKDSTLRKRLKAYMNYLVHSTSNHRSGRYIWQLRNHDDLIICWKEISEESPRNVEKKLLVDFKNQFGKRPFANLTG